MKCGYCKDRDNLVIYDSRIDKWFCELGCILNYRTKKMSSRKKLIK